MKLRELRELTRDELLQRQNEIEDERFNLNMQKSFKALSNPLRFRMIRREAAKIKTILREDEMEIRILARAKTSILEQMDTEKKK